MTAIQGNTGIKRHWIISFLIYFNFLFPTFNAAFQEFSLGFAAGAVILHGLLIILLLFALLRGDNKGVGARYTPYYLFFFFFMILITISLFTSFGYVTIRDLFELHRPLLYGLAFIVPLVYTWNEAKLNRYVVKPLFVVWAILILFGLFYTLNIELGRNIMSFYTKAHNVYTMRTTGTFPNPYDYAYFLVLPIISYIHCLFLERKKLRKILYLALLFLAGYALLLSQSRTGFIVLFSALCYYVIIITFFAKFKQSVKVIVTAAIIVLLVGTYVGHVNQILHDNFRYLYAGLITLIEEGPAFQSSLVARYNQIQWVLSELNDHPFRFITGFGPGKELVANLESQYGLYLFRYGLPGLFIVFIYLIYSILISFKAYLTVRRNSWGLATESLFLSFHVWCVVLAVAALVNPFIDMARLAFIFFFLNGLATALVSSPRTQLGGKKL